MNIGTSIEENGMQSCVKRSKKYILAPFAMRAGGRGGVKICCVEAISLMELVRTAVPNIPSYFLPPSQRLTVEATMDDLMSTSAAIAYLRDAANYFMLIRLTHTNPRASVWSLGASAL